MKIYSFDVVLLAQFEEVCLSMSGSNCCVLTGYSDSHLLKNFPQFVVIHIVKGFSVVNEAEVDVFWNSLAFYMIQQMWAI